MPGGGATSALIKFGVIAGLDVYGVANSLYNVEGRHCAIFSTVLVVSKQGILAFCSFGSC
ncbi:hypothetical protein KY285_004704 [Solanum tuberosum]|nr:hypothetical protein KY285_004704 [Solanum tuberosum]